MAKKQSVGRPTNSAKMKKSAKIFINMTEEQKKKLVEKADESDLSLSHICLQALKQCGYI